MINRGNPVSSFSPPLFKKPLDSRSTHSEATSFMSYPQDCLDAFLIGSVANAAEVC
jgi:hypothetical protein